MCGEIEKWQTKREICVRLTTGGLQSISLGDRLERCVEIRIDEIMFVNFNTATSGSCYVDVRAEGMHSSGTNNEKKPGILVPVDVLNPHAIYQRPRTLAVSPGTDVTQFEVDLRMPDGSVPTFTEAVFVLTFVMQKSPDVIAANRREKAMTQLPSMLDPGRNYYQGN